MRLIRKVLLGLLALVVILIGAAMAYLLIAPPDLLRVATGYSAKIVCSNVFLADRDAGEVLAVDVQAPGHPLLGYVGVSVDREGGSVTARLLGMFAPNTAIYRPGLGCASVPDGDVAKARAVQLATQPDDTPLEDREWPDGDAVTEGTNDLLAGVLADEGLTGPGMRAVVVVKNGRIVGEAYGGGFAPETRLLGWSMAKTVNASIIGVLARAGLMKLDDTGLVPEWTDARAEISLADLLGMESGLAFNEEYGDVSDVLRMLFIEPDMAGFAAAQPQIAPPEKNFNYASGTATLLSRIWMGRVGGGERALALPRAALFDPLGMKSAVIEADETGTLVGSSYMYATARDWARFGQFLLQGGVWNGNTLLPPGWVKAMGESNGLPGDYSRMQSWLDGPRETDSEFGVPEDAFWMLGHDGQSVAIVPSEGLVVVRLGLTPSKLGWGPEPMVRAVMDAVRG